MDYLNTQIAIAKMGKVTRQQFGKFLHDPDKTDEEKWAFIEKIEAAGGYDALLSED